MRLFEHVRTDQEWPGASLKRRDEFQVKVVEGGKIAVKFGEAAIDEEKLSKITKDSIEKPGYRTEE